ncbi:unnamed protein product [Adineta steineri]|uniref:FAD-binding domain-containing protein n=1 Tax=Adineta steineri TaxID=433720 RepID=A0A814ZN06_9BILA|nr:unnamed protein product [Adineta steineri]CAF3929087.1 unnamed protein product [Adineta steineri]
METQDNCLIIAGAGIGGLATALALQRNGLSCQIYERDRDFESRRQGYSLTIQKNGFEALENLGISENVRKLGADSIISGTSTYNSFGEVIFSKPKKHNNKHRFNNFAVARQSLRACLLNELNPDVVHWNKEIIRYESIPENSKYIRIIFSDNTSIIARALIGCDGVRSSIRKQMLGDDLNYLGVWAINGISPHQTNPLILNQTVQILDGKSRLFIKPYSLDKCMWQLTFKVSKDDEIYDQLVQKDFQGLLNKAQSATKDWYESITKLIHDTPINDIRGGPIYDRDPLENIKKDFECVTMLGDAVHPMSPFKGQGANQALMDAVSLVQYILKYGDDIEKAFIEFETEMLNRSRSYILRSRFAVEFLHTDNALLTENMIEFVHGKLVLK